MGNFLINLESVLSLGLFLLRNQRNILVCKNCSFPMGTNRGFLAEHLVCKNVQPWLTVLFASTSQPSLYIVPYKWPEYWSFRFSISPSNEHLGLISFRIDWLYLLAVQGSLKGVLLHHNSKASTFRCREQGIRKVEKCLQTRLSTRAEHSCK